MLVAAKVLPTPLRAELLPTPLVLNDLLIPLVAVGVPKTGMVSILPIPFATETEPVATEELATLLSKAVDNTEVPIEVGERGKEYKRPLAKVREPTAFMASVLNIPLAREEVPVAVLLRVLPIPFSMLVVPTPELPKVLAKVTSLVRLLVPTAV